jgi:hypothetical protein
VISDQKKTTPIRLNLSTTQRLNVTSTFLLLTSYFLLSSCAGSSHPQPVSPSEGPPTHRYLELYREKQIATLHFPAGVYTLDAVDKIGYYYRAPRKISEAGSAWRDGGIFVSKRDPNKLRGYVWRAGAITHVGNLSHVKHRLFDQDVPAEYYH